MTIISIEEFRKQMDRYLAATAQNDIVLTQDGKPCYVLRSIRADNGDDVVESAEFWAMIRQRRQEQGIPWEDAKKQLDLD